MGLINPWDFLPKGNEKIAKETTEIYAGGQNARGLSKDFKSFVNLEVLWINNNEIEEVTNLEENFRIKELYAQNNKITSLQGFLNFKFLSVLLLSDNCLWNLDRQIEKLGAFGFLKKLDLFDNPLAEEAEYRLRIIYNMPQLDVLDRKSIKGHERQRADEIVPGMEHVLAVAPGDVEPAPKNKWQNTRNEEYIFKLAKKIKAKWRLAEEEAARALWDGMTGGQTIDYGDTGLINNTNLKLQEYRRLRVLHDSQKLNEWEKSEFLGWFKKLKEERKWENEKKFSKEEFIDDFLKEDSKWGYDGSKPTCRLMNFSEGIGKVPDPAWIAPPSDDPEDEVQVSEDSIWKFFELQETEDGEDPQPGKITLEQFKNWLLGIPWSYEVDDVLNDRISYFGGEAKKADINGDMTLATDFSQRGLRLEGVKTRKMVDVDLTVKKVKEVVDLRSDVLPQYALLTKLVTNSKGITRTRVDLGKSTFRL